MIEPIGVIDEPMGDVRKLRNYQNKYLYLKLFHLRRRCNNRKYKSDLECHFLEGFFEVLRPHVHVEGELIQVGFQVSAVGVGGQVL